MRQAQVLCSGEADGIVLRLQAPISFWGGVSAETARITMAGHPQWGLSVSDRVLVIPRTIGSSSSSAVLLELIHRQIAPAAIILGEGDAILPIGVVVARQMGWTGLPVLVLREAPFGTGEHIRIEADGNITPSGSAQTR
jgi:predicted aconitase with swiveling domain